MKKILTIVAAAMAVLAIASCEQEVLDALKDKTEEGSKSEEAADSSEVVVPDAIAIASMNVSFVNTAAVQSVTFTATTSWSAASDSDWITVTPDKGEAGECTVNIAVSENETYASRNGSVTVTAGTVKFVFNVAQGAPAPVFAAGIQNNITSDEQQVVLVINSNEDYKVSISEDAQDWIEVADTKGAPVISKIVLNVSENTGLEERSAVILVEGSEASQVFYLVQKSAYVQTSLESASYLGMANKIYDAENWMYLDYAQFAIELNGADGNTVVLALNAASDADATVFPEGSFTLDYECNHAEGTFSVFSDEEAVYTGIYPTSGASEIYVVDGTVDVTAEDGVYSISCAFLGYDGESYLYSFVGEIAELKDASLKAVGLEMNYRGDYDTYFTTKAKEICYSFTISRAVDENTPELNYVSLSLYYDAAADGSSFPAGKYTIAEGNEYATDSESKYASGITLANPGTFTFYGNDKTQTYYFEMADGSTIEFAVDEEGEPVIIFDASVRTYYYDEETYEPVYNNEWTDFKATIPAFNNIEITSNVAAIQLDEDHEFQGYVSAGQIGGQYFGDQFGVGNVFLYGYSTGIDDVYSMQVILNSDGEWTFEKNFYSRYCNTPLPDGVYNFVDSLPAAKGDYICNVVNTSSMAYNKIGNSYTGSFVIIDKGSIELAGDEMKVNVEGELYYSDKTPAEQRISYTGTIPNTMGAMSYFKDMSTKTTLSWVGAE